jgi:uncharacterized protein YggE
MRLNTLTVLVLLVPVALFAMGCAQRAAAPGTLVLQESTGITVTGEGKTMARPDRAVFNVGVEVHRATIEEARANSATAIDGMLTALRGLGIADDDIRTAQLNIGPDYEYGEAGRRLVGYVATSTIEVRMTDLEKIGKAIDTTVAAGGNDARLDGLRFELSDPEAARGEARAAAVANARTRAEQLAAASGVTLGAPVVIEEQASGGGPEPVMMRMQAARAESADATPIQPGTSEIFVQVRVRWEIAR